MAQYDNIVNSLMAGKAVHISANNKDRLAGIRSAFYRQRTRLQQAGFLKNTTLSVTINAEAETITLRVEQRAPLEFNVVTEHEPEPETTEPEGN